MHCAGDFRYSDTLLLLLFAFQSNVNCASCAKSPRYRLFFLPSADPVIRKFVFFLYILLRGTADEGYLKTKLSYSFSWHALDKALQMTFHKVVCSRAETTSIARAVRHDKPVKALHLLLAGLQWQPRWPAFAGARQMDLCWHSFYAVWNKFVCCAFVPLVVVYC